MDPFFIVIGAVIVVAIAFVVLLVISYKHRHKWGEPKDGYQSCLECGLSIPVPAMSCEHKWSEPKDGYQTCLICKQYVLVPTSGCSHKWKQYENRNILRAGNTVGIIYIMDCEKCGDRKSYKAEI